jgi:hypothetical protein
MACLAGEVVMSLKRTYRPEVVVLEERVACSVLVAGFNGNGIWRFTDGAGWKQLGFVTPVSVAVNDKGDVAASFNNGGGVWRYENSAGWQLLTYTFAASVGIDDTDRVFADLDPFGIWRFADTGGWMLLTSANPSVMAVAASGDLVASFHSFQNAPGLWRFEDATGWQKLTFLEAQAAAIAANGDVAASFNGFGTWGDNSNTGWVRLTPLVANTVGVNNKDFVSASFPGFGTWYNGGFWNQTSVIDSSLIGIGNDNHQFAAQPDGVFEIIPGVLPKRISALTPIAIGVASGP